MTRKRLYPSFGILLVDDELPWLRSLSMTLEGPAAMNNLIQCHDSRKVMDILARRDIGLVLLDLTMPHIPGEELLEKIIAEHPEISVIIFSGLNQLETAVRCMRLGAFDYFVKTVEEKRLVDGVRRAVRMVELEHENRAMRQRFFRNSPESPEAFSALVTEDPSMQAAFQYVEAVAPSSQPILITGESGTGKELVARAIHQLSRPDGPLINVNVSGLDDNYFADTLFGHVRGAYTGADSQRSGLIEQAAEGTLFLDEIGDLSSASQVKLLRLLQEGEFYPLGSDHPKQMTARVVVATHQNLEARMSAGEFRRDLYYRLLAHHVHLPPLRERKDDLPLLLNHFLAQAAEKLDKKTPTPPPELAVLLSTYNFPGNVRELESMIYDAVSVHSSHVLSMKSFQGRIGQQDVEIDEAPTASGSNPFAGLNEIPTLQQAGQLLVEDAMRRAAGNQSIASRLLGISQPALSKRLKK